MIEVSADVSAAIKLLQEHGYGVISPMKDGDFVVAEEEGEALPSSELYLYIGGVVACMLTAALAAGLTMGLLSIDPHKMAIKHK